MMPGARSSFSRTFDEIVLHNGGSQCFLGSGKHINIRKLGNPTGKPFFIFFF